MLKLRRELYLTLKALGADTRGELGSQNLHRDFPPECYFLGDEETAHATAAELALDGVGRS
jgi:hypothetical protein